LAEIFAASAAKFGIAPRLFHTRFSNSFAPFASFARHKIFHPAHRANPRKFALQETT
jgi:hypothetical protein